MLEIWVFTGNFLIVALATNMDPVDKTFIDGQVGCGILCSGSLKVLEPHRPRETL